MSVMRSFSSAERARYLELQEGYTERELLGCKDELTAELTACLPLVWRRGRISQNPNGSFSVAAGRSTFVVFLDKSGGGSCSCTRFRGTRIGGQTVPGRLCGHIMAVLIFTAQ